MLVYATISVLNLVISASYAQAPSPLTQAQIDAYNPYTYFAAAAFCKEDALDEWKCGGESLFHLHLTHGKPQCPLICCRSKLQCQFRLQSHVNEQSR
jgi:hypothetical protein